MNALNRLRRSTRRTLLRFGAEVFFQRYVATKDWDEGKESQSVSGAPVPAAMAKDQESVSKAGGDDGDRKVVTREEVWHAEVPAFEAFGGLSEEWRVTVPAALGGDGSERRIKSAVLCDDETYYILRLGSGG